MDADQSLTIIWVCNQASHGEIKLLQQQGLNILCLFSSAQAIRQIVALNHPILDRSGLKPGLLERLHRDWIQGDEKGAAEDDRVIDVVIVSEPRYLGRILTRYSGPVFYRSDVPPGKLSPILWKLSYFRIIQERENFWILPSSASALVGEHAWVQERMRVVPIASSQDVAVPLAEAIAALKCDRTPPPQPVIVSKCHGLEPSSDVKRLYVLFHFPGPIVRLNTQGEYLSPEGIPRVVRRFVEAVLAKTRYQVVITCRAGQLEACHGFFEASRYPGRIKFFLLDPEDTEFQYQSKVRKAWMQICRQYMMTWRWLCPWVKVRSQWTAQVIHRRKNIKSSWLWIWQLIWLKRLLIYLAILPLLTLVLLASKAETLITTALRENLKKLVGYESSPPASMTIGEIDLSPPQTTANNVEDAQPQTTPLKKFLKLYHKFIQKYSDAVNRRYDESVVYNELTYLETVNQDEQAAYVWIPHYYLFPESALIEKKTIVYLPDYMPHFFGGQKFAGSLDRWHDRIGYTMVHRATSIFTNSRFSQAYLPDTVLEVEPEKIHVLPIPLLMKKVENNSLIGNRVQAVIDGSQYLFYPTQDRPNKQLPFLLKLFNELLQVMPDLKLILTANIHIQPRTKQVFTDLKLQNKVILLEGISDKELYELYRRAAALPFTSTMEGNFPPQIFEALTLQTPVVATRIPLITEALGDVADRLLLCEPLDLAGFREKLLYALRYPQQVRDRQRVAYHRILEQYNDEHFADAVADFLANLP